MIGLQTATELMGPFASAERVNDGWLINGETFHADGVIGEAALVDWVEPAHVVTPAERNALLIKIDADTDAIYRAVQGDRAAEYLLAETEALAYKAAGYTGTVPSSVASWAAAKSQTAQWATDDILGTAAAWRLAQAAIRAQRLGKKELARTAADLVPVVAQWAGFVATIRAALGVSTV